MSWNYRVCMEPTKSGEPTYSIREVYYNDDGSVKAWSAECSAPFGESVKELQKDLTRMLNNLISKPVLDLTQDPPQDLP